MTEVP